MQANRQFRQQL
ncbi:hypothetical protein D039_1359A, partial [Vibrio parahaemolyticus EKP-028]